MKTWETLVQKIRMNQSLYNETCDMLGLESKRRTSSCPYCSNEVFIIEFLDRGLYDSLISPTCETCKDSPSGGDSGVDADAAASLPAAIAAASLPAAAIAPVPAAAIAAVTGVSAGPDTFDVLSVLL
jgi:hypothetical protein